MTNFQTTRWGLCGAGRIGQDFAKVLIDLSKDHSQLLAVATRDIGRAQKFASEHHIPKAYGSYEELAKDADIDVVYINTITSSHYKLCKLFLHSGKNVLCEKPMCLNLQQTRDILQLAKSKNLFFMEGFWTRCFPVMDKLRQELEADTIGEVQDMVVNFGFCKPDDPRIISKEMGGGAVLDLACYPIQMARLVFPENPMKITATGCLFPSGVDLKENITMIYSGNRMASLNVTAGCNMDQTVLIFGTKGFIKIPDFWRPSEIVINGDTHSFPLPKFDKPLVYTGCQGFVYEQKCVHECLNKGAKECCKISHEDSLAIVGIMDEVRKQLGVVFEEDKCV